MRYLSFLAAVLASAPAYAQVKDKIELQPGFAERWQAPQPFTKVVVGNPDIVDVVQGPTNQEMNIITKPDGGTTNIVLKDENGNQVANLLVTNCIPNISQHGALRLALCRSTGKTPSAILTVTNRMIARRLNALMQRNRNSKAGEN